MQIPDVVSSAERAVEGWYTRHKEVALLIAGGIVTFSFTKLLPWMLQSGSTLSLRTLSRVSGRLRRRVALGEYLNWVVLQSRDLNLTGIVGTAEKPQLEQVFISVKIHSTSQPAESAEEPDTEQPPSWLPETVTRLKAVFANIRPQFGRRKGRRDAEGAGCAALFSPKLFPTRSFARVRRWLDRYNVLESLALATGCALVFVIPAWSAFGSTSINTVASAWAGLIWGLGAGLGIAMIADDGGDLPIRITGWIIVAVFGGAIIAAVIERQLRHQGLPIVLIAGTLAIALLLFAARHLSTMVRNHSS